MVKLVIKIEDKSSEDKNEVNVSIEKFNKKELEKATEYEKIALSTVYDKVKQTLNNLVKEG